MRKSHEWIPTFSPTPLTLSRPNHPHPPRTQRAEGPTYTSLGRSPRKKDRAEGAPLCRRPE